MNLQKIKFLYDKCNFNDILSTFDKDVYLKFFLAVTVSKGDAFKKFYKLCKDSDISISNKVSSGLTDIFNSEEIDNEFLINFIESYYEEYFNINEEELIIELSKLPAFDRGGIYQNALESKIVKQIQRHYKYNDVKNVLEGELFQSYLSYGLSSWFNYWSSTIIENYFKKHEKVIPTVGLVKHFDFIYDGIPLDLKVTYLPQEFVDGLRNGSGNRSEMYLLKQNIPGEHGIDFSKNNLATMAEAMNIAKNLGLPIFNEIKEYRNNTVVPFITSTEGKKTLISRLYENQGERRFDNAYKIFLICIDDSDIINARSMKAHKGLGTIIKNHLDKGLEIYDINYMREGRRYDTKASLIIVKKSDLAA